MINIVKEIYKNKCIERDINGKGYIKGNIYKKKNIELDIYRTEENIYKRKQI